MLKFIEGDKLVEEFCALRSQDAHADIAVAFWGRGAATELKINKDGHPRIICNLESGACDPDEIKKMKDAGLEIRSHRQLHAKVYFTETGAIVGSANASTNGLAMQGSFSAWREANILFDDSATLKELRTWFDKIWKVARDISDDDIKNARRIWKERRKLAPTKYGATSLFKAFADDPTLFRCVHCLVVFENNLGSGAKRLVKRFEQEDPGLASTFHWWWQPTTPLQQDFWLIRCDFTKKQHPKVSGYARMPNPIIQMSAGRGKEPDVYPAVKEASLRIGTRLYKLTDDQKSILLKNLQMHRVVKNAHGNDVVVPLGDVIPSSSA
jgi:hypothetical protein